VDQDYHHRYDEDDEPPPLLSPEDDDSVSDEEDDPDDDDTIGTQEDTSPFIVDNSSSHQQHPKHDRRAPQLYTDGPRQAAKHWTEAAHSVMILDLLQAFQAETKIDAPGSDTSLFEPVPQSIRQILKIKDPAVRKAWLKAVVRRLNNSSLPQPSALKK
jgi:hypothetical protein